MEFWITLSCTSGCSTRRCACQKAELKCTGFYRCCDYTNSSDQNTDENELSKHDNDNYGPLFKLHGDDADLWYI